jgi:transcriptional regulator with XRE-family HTH domain
MKKYIRKGGAMIADGKIDGVVQQKDTNTSRKERVRHIREMAFDQPPDGLTMLWERLYYLFKVYDVKQKDIADRLYVGQPHLSAILNEKTNASDDLLKRIAELFDVRFDWLKNGNGQVFVANNYFGHDQVVRRKHALLQKEVELTFGEGVKLQVVNLESFNNNQANISINTHDHEPNKPSNNDNSIMVLEIAKQLSELFKIIDSADRVVIMTKIMMEIGRLRAKYKL